MYLKLIFFFIFQTNDDDITLMQVFTLVALMETPMTASEIARKRNVSLQSVSSLTQSLVERGLLTRVRKPDDRRQYLLQVTEAGITLAEQTKQTMVNYATDLLRGMTEEELAAASIFLPALKRLSDLSPPDSENTCR